MFTTGNATITAYKRDGNAIPSDEKLYMEAYEEVVADSMTSMFADPKAYEKLAELKKQDKTLWQKFGDVIKAILDKLKSLLGVYDGVSYESKEAEYVAQFSRDVYDKLQDLYIKAFVGAEENYQAAQGDGAADKHPKKRVNEVHKGIRYSFSTYTDRQKENWKNSKRIVLYENEAQFRDFISKARNDKDFGKKIYFGAIPSDLAELIKAETGINVENFNCSLSAYEIRKIFKDHSNEAKEGLRGQRAITEDDIVDIPTVIQSPKKIELSAKKYEGKPAIEFSKSTNGTLTVVAVVSDKHLDLFVQTAYVGIKKGNLPTPIGEQAPINTPKANNGTVSKDSISQDPEIVNRKFSERDSYSEREANAPIIQIDEDAELTKRIQDSKKSKYAVIKDYLIEKLYGQSFTLSDGIEAIIDKRDAQELSHKADARKTSVLSNLREIITKARFSHVALGVQHKKFDAFRYYSAKVSFSGETFDILLNVGRSKYTGEHHIYDITKKGRTANQSSTGLSRPVGYAMKNSSSSNSILQDPEIVNRKFSERSTGAEQDPYSYEALVSKPDMKVTTISSNVPKNRADVVAQAKKNAAKVGKINPKDGSVRVRVNDIEKEIVLGAVGLKHGLDRRFNELAPITLQAGEILQNSIRINELVPSKAEADSSYILIGSAQSSNGDLYIVRSIVNQFSNELESMDVLYAISAKKSTVALNAPKVSTPRYRTTISIAQLLDLVNRYFPDILPESVLKHFGYDARPDGKFGESVLYQERDPDSISNRSLLANALESAAKEGEERNILRNYKTKLRLIEAEQAKLADVREKAHDLRFKKGRTAEETKTLNGLDLEAKQIAKRTAVQIPKKRKNYSAICQGITRTWQRPSPISRKKSLESSTNVGASTRV